MQEKDLSPSPSLQSLFVPKAVQQNRSTTHDHVSITESNMISDSLVEIDHVGESKLEAKNIAQNISLSFGNLFLHPFG